MGDALPLPEGESAEGKCEKGSFMLQVMGCFKVDALPEIHSAAIITGSTSEETSGEIEVEKVCNEVISSLPSVAFSWKEVELESRQRNPSSCSPILI